MLSMIQSTLFFCGTNPSPSMSRIIQERNAGLPMLRPKPLHSWNAIANSCCMEWFLPSLACFATISVTFWRNVLTGSESSTSHNSGGSFGASGVLARGVGIRGVGILSGVGSGVSSGISLGGREQQHALMHLYISYTINSIIYKSAYNNQYNRFNNSRQGINTKTATKTKNIKLNSYRLVKSAQNKSNSLL